MPSGSCRAATACRCCRCTLRAYSSRSGCGAPIRSSSWTAVCGPPNNWARKRSSCIRLSAGNDATPKGSAIRLASGTAPLLSANPVVELMAPEPPEGVVPIGPGHQLAGLVHLGEGCDVRPVLSTLRSATDGRPPVIQLWARPRGVAPDALFALLCGDLSAPVTFAVDRTGWAPTVALTAYLRALPADGWLRVLCTCVEIGQDWFDEDHIVVDRLGRIVVQTRQLAMVPAQ